MYIWNREIPSLTATEINNAVQNEGWQRYRRSMKGLATSNKLDCLNGYLGRREHDGICERVHYVRVANYINALLRGGQLVRTSSGRVQVQR